MDFLRFIVFDILGVTPLLVGFIALIGLLIQRKPIEKVLSGTFKTIVGFLVLPAAPSGGHFLGNFQTLFSDGFGLKGRHAAGRSANRTGANQIRHVRVADHGDWFWLEPVFARVTPFKYIFLTGQHNLYLSALLTVTLKALGYTTSDHHCRLHACWVSPPASIRLLRSRGCEKLPVTMRSRWGITSPWPTPHPAGSAQSRRPKQSTES